MNEDQLFRLFGSKFYSHRQRMVLPELLRICSKAKSRNKVALSGVFDQGQGDLPSNLFVAVRSCQFEILAIFLETIIERKFELNVNTVRGIMFKKHNFLIPQVTLRVYISKKER